MIFQHFETTLTFLADYAQLTVRESGHHHLPALSRLRAFRGTSHHHHLVLCVGLQVVHYEASHARQHHGGVGGSSGGGILDPRVVEGAGYCDLVAEQEGVCVGCGLVPAHVDAGIGVGLGAERNGVWYDGCKSRV